MESVDVLSHHCREFPLLLPPGQDLMGDIGFKAQRQHLLPVKPEEIRGPPLVEGVGDDGLRRIVKFLGIQAIHTAEIRDARFRAYPRAAEKDNAAALADP